MQPIKIPVWAFSPRERRMKVKRKPVFALFPVRLVLKGHRIRSLLQYLIAIVFVWVLSAILTVTGALPEKSAMRTDVQYDLIENSPWFNVPYPGAFGVAKLSSKRCYCR
jgi:hypothetical protein